MRKVQGMLIVCVLFLLWLAGCFVAKIHLVQYFNSKSISSGRVVSFTQNPNIATVDIDNEGISRRVTFEPETDIWQKEVWKDLSARGYAVPGKPIYFLNGDDREVPIASVVLGLSPIPLFGIGISGSLGAVAWKLLIRSGYKRPIASTPSWTSMRMRGPNDELIFARFPIFNWLFMGYAIQGAVLAPCLRLDAINEVRCLHTVVALSMVFLVYSFGFLFFLVTKKV